MPWLKRESRRLILTLARDLCGHQAQASADGFAAFEAEMLAGFVMLRAVESLVDSTIRNDTNTSVRLPTVGNAGCRGRCVLRQGPPRCYAYAARSSHRRMTVHSR